MIPGPPFTRNLITFCYVDNEDGCIYQLRTECCRQIISAAFDEKKFNIREAFHHLIYCFQIHGSVFTYGCVRASTCLYTNDPLYRKNAVLCRNWASSFV